MLAEKEERQDWEGSPVGEHLFNMSKALLD
jgi:hypothetical protein